MRKDWGSQVDRGDQRITPHRATASRKSVSPISTEFSPFHLAAKDYFKAGYLPIPLPLGRKYPPPKGTPNELEITEERIQGWLNNPKPRNIGTIVPDGIGVIDVDGISGQESLEELEIQLGPLPATWMTFHGDPEHYHLWFKTPPKFRLPGQAAAGIDFIHRHYRYVMLPPSIHPNGSQYRWAKR